MQFLREYAVNIVIISVLAVILEIILPSKNFKKYITVNIGLIVMMVIVSPVESFFKDFNTFVIDADNISDFNAEIISKEPVLAEFKRRLQEEIQNEVESTFKTKCNCSVTFNVNDNGEITEIKKVEILPYNMEIIKFVSERYGIEREKIGGMAVGGN